MKQLNTSILVNSTCQLERHVGDQHQIPIFEKWLVEIWNKGRLQDIVEMTYDTELLAYKECERRRDEMQQDNQNLLDRYAAALEDFVMDRTDEDREPAEPTYYTHQYFPRKYLCTIFPDGRFHTLIYEF